MPILPIHQQITFLMVRDLEATDAFYQGLLDLPLAVDQGSCRIYRVTGDAYLGFCQRPEAADSTRNVILTLIVPDVDGWYEQLVKRGVPFEKPPAINPEYNIYHCFARDPDGYLVEIQRFLDPVMTRLPLEAEPADVAAIHYRALVEDDKPLWQATLKAFYRQVAENRGSTPDTWWQAGRRMAQEYGVSYELDHVAWQDEEAAKIFFKRLHADGSQRGRPLPIHLILEDNEWRVNVVSY